MKRTWNLAPVFPIVQKITGNYCPCLYLSLGQVWWLPELRFKRYIEKCTLSHVLIFILMSDSANHGMVKNTKTWISWKRKIIFLRNKKILKLCLRWHILRSYGFAVEVTFKMNSIFPVIKNRGLYRYTSLSRTKTCMVFSHFWTPSPNLLFIPHLGYTHSPTVTQFIQSPRYASPWPLNLLKQRHRYYICNNKKYFVNKPTTFSLYQKSF